MKDAAEIEKFVRLEDVETECSCASRKCGPHRCWPSKVGWIIVAILLAYTVSLQSFAFTSMETTLQKEIRRHDEAFQRQLLTLWHEQHEELLRSFLDQTYTRMQAIEQVLERAAHVEWAVLTPAVEQTVQLKTALEAVEQRVMAVERDRP